MKLVSQNTGLSLSIFNFGTISNIKETFQGALSGYSDKILLVGVNLESGYLC